MKLLKRSECKKIPDGLIFRDRTSLYMTIKNGSVWRQRWRRKPAKIEIDERLTMVGTGSRDWSLEDCQMQQYLLGLTIIPGLPLQFC